MRAGTVFRPCCPSQRLPAPSAAAPPGAEPGRNDLLGAQPPPLLEPLIRECRACRGGRGRSAGRLHPKNRGDHANHPPCTGRTVQTATDSIGDYLVGLALAMPARKHLDSSDWTQRPMPLHWIVNNVFSVTLWQVMSSGLWNYLKHSIKTVMSAAKRLNALVSRAMSSLSKSKFRPAAAESLLSSSLPE